MIYTFSIVIVTRVKVCERRSVSTNSIGIRKKFRALFLSLGHTATDNDPKKSLALKIHIRGHTAAITINLSLYDNNNDFRIAL